MYLLGRDLWKGETPEEASEQSLQTAHLAAPSPTIWDSDTPPCSAARGCSLHIIANYDMPKEIRLKKREQGLPWWRSD